ncbi:MAG: hypothetical protein ACK6BU_10750, partial [Cyanobacteriota bacterium]
QGEIAYQSLPGARPQAMNFLVADIPRHCPGRDNAIRLSSGSQESAHGRWALGLDPPDPVKSAQ